MRTRLPLHLGSRPRHGAAGYPARRGLKVAYACGRSFNSSKPTGHSPTNTGAPCSEPALDESAAKEQIAVSILDLSRSDMVGKALETVPAKAPNADEDDLDIPAFLRRQAN